MSIKDLFNKIPESHRSPNSASSDVESYDYVLAKNKKQTEFVPRLDFSTASNFAIYGSAEEYYKTAIERIYNYYPYDGSKKEKIQFSLSSSYIDDWLYTNKYPKTTGYINFSYDGWGALSTMTQGYGLPTSTEYIYSRGGMHTASEGMAGSPLYKTFNKSVKYDTTLNRTTNYRMNIPDGVTVEFWLKKDSFDTSKTEKEVILDLWNGELSSSSDYGRMTIALSSSAQSDGSDTFLLTLQSGNVGFFEQSIGSSNITTGSLSNWHHYAISFSSASNGIATRIYLDGVLNDSQTLGSSGVDEIGGLVNAYIGALQTSPSSSNGTLSQNELKYAGKLSASLDEFRYWKTLRTSKQIQDNWNRNLGAGTNTDESNVNLGVYYKFNEGITTTASIDSVVLDYSGRIANGNWTGYSSGARNTSSAIEESNSNLTEEKDPIIYRQHPQVSALLTEMQNSGSLYDQNNGNMLLNKMPSWIVDDDGENNNHLKNLTQIISSYLDKLNAQISQLKNNKFIEYTEGSIKPLTFSRRLVEEKGFTAADILINSEILEFFENRDKNGNVYENEIFDIKNMIYQNIYNNLNYILKSKGTEDSFRNLIRCFGIDDEILKINRYTDKGTHYFTDKVKHTSIYKKFIKHNKNGNFDGTVFQTSSAQNSLTFISGSSSDKKEKNNAFTFEINFLAPNKPKSNEDSYIEFTHITSSIGGFHQAREDHEDYAWNSDDLANLQMYFIREATDSVGGYFQLKNYDGTISLTSSYFREVYNDHNWTVAARIKPFNYPYSGIENSPDEPTYKLEFYGAHHRGDTLVDSFLVTSSLNYETGSSYMCERKRIYVGAHWSDFTGSVLNYSDLSIGTCRFYLDYLEDDVLLEHNKNIKNYGSNKTFEGGSLVLNETENKKLNSSELLLLNWDFETVTGSDSGGNFVVDDVSSGSTDTIYGYLDNIVGTEHRGRGYSYNTSTSNFVDNNFIYSAKKELPEISYTSDDIRIKGDVIDPFIEDEDVSDNFYAFEKGMYQVISEEMLNTMSSVTEMNNLVGKVVDRYRFNYKNLDYMRRVFFEKVQEDPDLDKFTEYFKWIDKSIYAFLEQLVPISVRYTSKISDVVESHIFERNKVRSLIPNKFVNPSPTDHTNAIRELKYNWKFGHAPGTFIPAVIGQIDFDLDPPLLINHGATLQVTGGATTFLAEINDPNSAVLYPDADLILRTGSTGLAFKASGSSVGVATGVNYGVSGDTLEDKSFTISWWYYSGDSSNSTGIFLKASSPSTVHRVEFDGDVQVKLYNTAGTNDSARFNDSNTQSDSGEWNHYVAFFDVDDLSTGGPRLWKNGTELTATGYTAIGGTTPSITGLSIQIDDQTGFQDLVFWSGSLSQADVNELYNSGSWYNPSLHTQNSNIIDWYKFGYESYWSGLGYSVGDDLSEQNPSDNKFISSSFGTGNNDLRILTAYDEDFQFVTGINPYGAAKTASEFWGEMSSSLSSSFEDFTVSFSSFSDAVPATFTMLSNSVGPETLAASETGTDFSSIVVTQGANSYVQITDNDNCLWQKERRERTDITARETIRQVIVNDNNQATNLLADESGTTYNASTYALRRLSRVYKEGVSMVQTIHGGTNYEIQKNRRISKNIVEPHSKLNSVGTPLNVLLVGAGSGQGIELETDCKDIEDPNYKQKYNVKTFSGKFAAGAPGGAFTPINDTAHYSFGMKGAFALPFNIFSASVKTGHNKIFDEGYKDGAYITNIHSDTVNERNDVPLQGPFTERWVGGHQSRHQDINRYNTSLIDGETLSAPTNNIHNQYTRPEGYRLLIIESGGSSDGAIGMVDAQYGVTGISGHQNSGSYPDVAKKKAVYFRDEYAKRPVNVKNIQTTTSSYSHGNYQEQYEILSVASGKQNNNPLFRTNVDTHQYVPSAIESTLPKTTNYKTLVGIGQQSNGNVFGQGASNLLDTATETSRATGSVQKSVISQRFSAPGGIETMTYGFLDAHNQEMSAYNALSYRNLLVRGSGSGESGTIRLNDHLGNRHGLLTHLSRHSGKFGSDSVYGSVTSGDYVTKPSFHKIPRNVLRKVVSGSSLSNPTFNEDHDNFFVSSTLPRSDYQYSWITSSLGDNYSITSGKQRMFGYAPKDGIVSSSYEVHGETGFVAAITFPTASELFGE